MRLNSILRHWRRVSFFWKTNATARGKQIVWKSQSKAGKGMKHYGGEGTQVVREDGKEAG